MKILIIADEEWNDVVFANGVLTNWFTGFEAEFAEMYCSPGLPLNNVCDRYFQLTDGQMLRSLYSSTRAGSIVVKPSDASTIEASKENAQRKGVYGIIKKMSLWVHTPIMMIRDFIWSAGRYNKMELTQFVNDFAPDVIFCPQYGTPKLWRLERYVHSICSAPMIAFTGDDETSYKQVSYSPLYWIRRWYCRQALKKTVGIFSHYMMHSKDQAEEYANDFGVPTSRLFKCGVFADKHEAKPVGLPILLVYAGRLYCNRWKSLAAIGEALRTINKDGVKMVLDIYTQEKLTSEQAKHLCEENFIYMKGSVPGSELPRIYREADIALHVESFDKKYMYATRVSFSTKIIDLMASTCAIMAICWNKQTGYQYLEEHDAAICIDSYDKILPRLQAIVDNPSIVQDYAKKAYECGKKNHSREIIQNQLKSTFEQYITK